MIVKDIQEMLENLIQISRNAGSIILEYYGSSEYDIKLKKDNSPLTIADRESDEYIRKKLKKLYSVPIISEENYPEYSIRRDFSDFFLVDPLDGTKEFIDKNGEFTVNIAYIRDHIPVMGVIFVPAKNILFFSGDSTGSYLMDKKGTHKLPMIVPSGKKLTATGSRKHRTDLDTAFIRMNNIDQVISAGSSLKFCQVAMGCADLYPRFQGSMEWDIAAGHLIAKESGCRVIDLTTFEEPRYNKESLKNNYFLVVRNGIDLSSIKLPESG